MEWNGQYGGAVASIAVSQLQKTVFLKLMCMFCTSQASLFHTGTIFVFG